MKNQMKLLAAMMIIFILFPAFSMAMFNQQEEEKGAQIKGTLLSSDNKPMAGVKFYLLKVPFKTADLKNKRKRKKLFKKMVFLPLEGKAVTDAEGRFVFKVVKIGNYFMSAALTNKNVEPGTDYVKSGKNNLLIIVEKEDDQFDIIIQSGTDLRVVIE